MAATLRLMSNTLRTSGLLLRPYSTLQTRASALVRKPTLLFAAKPSNQPILKVAQRNSHNASKQWKNEKLLTIALLGIIPAAMYLENPITDSLLAVSLLIHINWGLESIIIDYLTMWGAIFPKIGLAYLYVVMALTLTGLLYFNFKDIGISKAVKKIWAL